MININNIMIIIIFVAIYKETNLGSRVIGDVDLVEVGTWRGVDLRMAMYHSTLSSLAMV